jgi:hypothetical protein
MKIRVVGDEVFHADRDRQTDRETDRQTDREIDWHDEVNSLFSQISQEA